MLELSTEAAILVRDLAAAIAPDDALVRIAPSGRRGQSDWQVAFVETAGPDDKVWQSQGMTLCVAADLSRDLAGKLLEVTQRPDGRRLIVRSG